MKPLDVKCPHCGALPGERCVGRVVVHGVRIQRARAMEARAALARIHRDAFTGQSAR